MSTVSGSQSLQSPYSNKSHISEQDRGALMSSDVRTAMDKLNTDIKNNASPDTIAQDKNDAFAKYQAAGGQASSLQAFGDEASTSIAGGDTNALRQAFGLSPVAAGEQQTGTPAKGAVGDVGRSAGGKRGASI